VITSDAELLAHRELVDAVVLLDTPAECYRSRRSLVIWGMSVRMLIDAAMKSGR
jgi:hypothetical protein